MILIGVFVGFSGSLDQSVWSLQGFGLNIENGLDFQVLYWLSALDFQVLDGFGCS
jgi:hypothetical protein